MLGSSELLGIQDDACVLLSQILIGCLLLSQEYCKPIGWYWKTMTSQLYTLTCGVTFQYWFHLLVSYLWNLSGLCIHTGHTCLFPDSYCFLKLSQNWHSYSTHALSNDVNFKIGVLHTTIYMVLKISYHYLAEWQMKARLGKFQIAKLTHDSGCAWP